MPNPLLGTKTLLACLLLVAPAVSVAENCGDPSPTAYNGVSLHEEHSKTELTRDEVRAANAMLRLFEGNWEGQGIGIVCLGEGANARERVRHYEIEADGTGKRERGELKLDLQHDQGSRTERFRLVLNGSRLGTSSSPKNIVEVVSIGQDRIEWLYRFKANEGRAPFEARWQLNFDSTPGRQGRAATIEHWIYGQGGLASKGIWYLSNR